jgi:hypothetical protein
VRERLIPVKRSDRAFRYVQRRGTAEDKAALSAAIRLSQRTNAQRQAMIDVAQKMADRDGLGQRF